MPKVLFTDGYQTIYEGVPLSGLDKFFEGSFFKGFASPFFICFAGAFTFALLLLVSPWSMLFTLPMLFTCGFVAMAFAMS